MNWKRRKDRGWRHREPLGYRAQGFVRRRKMQDTEDKKEIAGSTTPQSVYVLRLNARPIGVYDSLAAAEDAGSDYPNSAWEQIAPAFWCNRTYEEWDIEQFEIEGQRSNLILEMGLEQSSDASSAQP